MMLNHIINLGKEKPLKPRNIIFFNYGIESNKVNDKNWKFDITYNRLGKQRLMLNPRDSFEHVDPHFSINSQITRVFSNKFEVYLEVKILITTNKIIQ